MNTYLATWKPEGSQLETRETVIAVPGTEAAGLLNQNRWRGIIRYGKDFCAETLDGSVIRGTITPSLATPITY